MIRRFFGGLWQAITVTKEALGNIIFILIVVVVVAALFSGDSDTIPDRTALIINPTGTIVEQKQLVDPIAGFLSGYDGEEPETALRDITDAIRGGAQDKRVKTLVLDLDRLQSAGLSKLEDISRAIGEFKQTGKPVYAFGGSYSQSQYYLASMADEVYIDESSFPVFNGVFLPGFGTYPIYFKSALDKLNVQFNVYKVGTYKGAVEPYLRDNMSDESRLANLAWLDTLWANYRSHITANRGISDASFDAFTNEYDELLATTNGNGNQLAVQQGLVDDLINREAWKAMMVDLVGSNGDTFQQTDFRDYLAFTRPPIPVVNPAIDKIAVVTASGVILDGDQPPGDVGSLTTIAMIDQARKDQSIKAIVLRVDSPGGSATASEEIRRALVQVQKEGKPVVVSMGSYAASGGYWISASANKIFANANTLTGSIGTFLTFPSLKTAANGFGVYSDGVGTTKLSNLLNPLEDVPKSLDTILTLSINNTYQRFIALVADGRDMTLEQADTVGQGRVWAAQAALDHGLIDAIGSLDDAIDSAALLADVANYDVLYVEQPLSTRDRILKEVTNSSLQSVHGLLGTSVVSQDAFKVLSLMKSELSTLLSMSRQPGIYVQCLDCKFSL
ncbi:MAG: protease-4 [Candidatus Azotimanducaceae bacterium]|jgi:protease-4